ncbi:MAG: [FeFe] hydrogenase H-cluster radical SAM maturase HydG [Deltaproteobacteria bacterium]|nr:[FeFe] hydrogenase H-cluster radical SAM maturase HydG [Deltaproteobacteria bacterium]
MIDEKEIEGLLEEGGEDESRAPLILDKALGAKGLTLEEAAILLNIKDRGLLDMLYKRAGEVKEKVFGKRVVLFAPLYLSNFCANGCLYCGFRAANTGVLRKALTADEAVKEASLLERMGFKRLLLVTGEDPRWGLDYIISSVRAIYKNTGIRIIHVNAPPMDTDALRELKASGAGVYQSFQETYHRKTYDTMHPSGKKRDYGYRISVMDRALTAGFQDVGIGPLLGLYDYRFDCLAAIAHSKHLYKAFGAEAHTISVPRLRPAEGYALKSVPHPVTDTEFKKIVAVFRLSVPSAGVVVSTREPAGLRDGLMHIGASQLSAASKTSPGGYAGDGLAVEQFSTNDRRTLSEVMASVVGEGFLPSLCASCYRSGRVGGTFMEKTLSGQMGKLCQANAILTLKEYIADYSKNGNREIFEKAVEIALREMKDPAMKKAVAEKLRRLGEGQRDIFF